MQSEGPGFALKASALRQLVTISRVLNENNGETNFFALPNCVSSIAV